MSPPPVINFMQIMRKCQLSAYFAIVDVFSKEKRSDVDSKSY